MGLQRPLNLNHLHVQWLCTKLCVGWRITCTELSLCCVTVTKFTKIMQLNSDLVCPMYRQMPPNHAQQLEIILFKVIDDICARFKHLLTSLDPICFDPEAFNVAIISKGAPLRNCWGFIGGTAQLISRPTKHQRIMFRGRKRVHCVKFQVGCDTIVALCCIKLTNKLNLICCSQQIGCTHVWCCWRKATWCLHVGS